MMGTVVINNERITVTCISCTSMADTFEEQATDTVENTDSRTEQLQKSTQELKDKEQKLRKLEKENELQECAKSKPKMESYIKKLEVRNEKLDRTVKTLLVKVELLENKLGHNIRTPIKTNNTAENETLVASIHSKVTNYILKQVDKQIESLDAKCRNLPGSKIQFSLLCKLTFLSFSLPRLVFQ